MTVSSTSNRAAYVGNGATTAFSFPYYFQSTADLVVIETIIATGVQTTKALTTDYTISGTTDANGFYSSGGTVNAVVAPASTVTWTIYRDPAATQTAEFVDNDPLPAGTLEAVVDKLTTVVQRVKDLISRSLTQPDGDATTIGRMPSKVGRASMFLAFDTNGDPIAAAGTSANLTPVSTFVNGIIDAADAATFRGDIGSTTVGDALFVAASAASARSTVGLGSSLTEQLTKAPTLQTFTSGSGTYTTPTGATRIRVRMVGGGGGGGSSAGTPANGSNGTASSFGSFTAVSGSGGAQGSASSNTYAAGGQGGSAGTGTAARFAGENGSSGLWFNTTSSNSKGGDGGGTAFGGRGTGGGNGVGVAAKANSGAGGGGAGANSYGGAGGGGGGEYAEFTINSPAVSYSYVVGAGGAGGAGAGANVGGAGADGIILVDEFYN